MNKVAIALALAVFIPLGSSEIAPRAADASEMSSQARVFPYCLRGGPQAGMRCRYASRAQCTRSASGVGGIWRAQPAVCTCISLRFRIGLTIDDPGARWRRNDGGATRRVPPVPT